MRTAGQMDVTEGKQDMTKLVEAFRNFSKAPKNVIFVLHVYEKLNQQHFIDGFIQNNFNQLYTPK
jgi:hypothetical protein